MTKNELKGYGCDSETSYFGLIIDSIENGQREQAIKQLENLDWEQLKKLANWCFFKYSASRKSYPHKSEFFEWLFQKTLKVI
jgi:hypothetical protein